MHKEWRPAEEAPSVDVFPTVTKRKKLRLVERQTGEPITKETVLDGALHELQNCLQSIGMGVDLLQLSQPEALECRTINLGIERASRLLREVQEYFFPPEIYLSTKNLGGVVVEAMQVITGDADGANIRFHLPESLPSFQYDWLMLKRVLERIFRCARGLLQPLGGEVMVSAMKREEPTPLGMELQVEMRGAEELEVEEERVFTPFWRVHDYQAGLGLVLARQAMHDRRGQLSFTKTSPCCAHFTVLLEILPEAAWSGRVRKEAGHGCVD
jgi:nitrogen-specific signal transduction histidine kinase